MQTRPYPDLERREIAFDGVRREVFVGGDGPAVIVMHEVPGLYPAVADFGRRLIAEGFSVYMPSLLGDAGRPIGVGYVAASMARACVAREFSTWAVGKTSPIIAWLRALAALARAERGGPGVGAIGMCLTGGFALGMMVDETVIAPVLSQPSLPFGLAPAQRRCVGVDDETLACVKARAAGGVDVLGLRFSHDPLVPDARWARLREVLGDRFISVEIDSSLGNPHKVNPISHSVLTFHLVDRPGHPTRDALDQVMQFFRDRLHGGTA